MKTAAILLSAMLALTCSSSAQEEKKEARLEQATSGSGPTVPNWPQQWGERKLYRGAPALIYAQKKSAADEITKLLGTVVEEARQDGVTQPAVGLIVVIDAQEKEKIKAYRQKLGLDHESKPQAGQEPGKAGSEAESNPKSLSR